MFSWGSKQESFDPVKVKANLKMAITRIRMQQNKTVNSVKIQQKQLAELMAVGKYDAARIKVEALIREDLSIEGLEVLALFCDLVASRIQVVGTSSRDKGGSGCPVELKEAITSILWASARIDAIPELQAVRNSIGLKFGKEFVEMGTQNSEFSVNQKIQDKLGIQTPTNLQCLEYLKSISTAFGLQFDDAKLSAGDSVIMTVDGKEVASQSGATATKRFVIPPIIVPRDELEARLLSLKRQ